MHHERHGTGREGRIKEAAGALSRDDELRARGKTGQAIGHLKQAAEEGRRG